MTSLAERVRVRVLAALVVALLVVGAFVAGVLHVQAGASLDVALLAAAAAHAIPHTEPDPLDLSPVPREISVQFLVAGAHHPASPWAAEAAASREPVLRSQDGHRYALVGLDGLGVGHHPGLEGEVVVAWAPEVTLVRTVGPFLLVYLLAASAVAVGAAAALRPLLHEALSPLATATREVNRVVGAGSGLRLGAGGPPEIAALISAVDDLLARLDLAFAAQSRFTAYAAHELRTPVAVLLGEAEVALRRERSTEEYRAALSRIAGAARDLGALVDGLVTLTRLDAGEAEHHRAPERLSALAYDAVRREDAALQAARVTLQVVVRADPEVVVHVPLVQLALANLLRNVARHAPGAHATLTVDARAEHAVFTVADDGPGIPEAARAHVFERYGRGPDPSSGLGLGLSLTREIARRHGGLARLLPTPHGTTIELTLRR